MMKRETYHFTLGVWNDETLEDALQLVTFLRRFIPEAQISLDSHKIDSRILCIEIEGDEA